MLEILHTIASTPGLNAKMALLRQHPELKEVIRYAYDPYKHFFMTEPPIDGEGILTVISFDILNRMSRRDIDTQSVLRYINSLDYDYAEVFKRILNKDLRIGLGAKSINKVWPGLIPTFAVQLAKLYERQRVSLPCFISPKLDGIRAIYKEGKLYTRNGHVIQGVDHIITQCKVCETLDGELLVPGKTFEESSGLLRSGNNVPDAVFYVFDIPGPEPLFERIKMIQHLYASHVRFVPHDEVYSHTEIMRAYYEHRQEGYEGSIVKDPEAPYYDGRNHFWMKIKNVDTHDLSVIGFFEGEGKYEGTLGGIIVDYNSVPVRVGSGFTDSQRDTIWSARDKYLGQIAEVHAQEETNGKSLRHPRFKGWRVDKHE